MRRFTIPVCANLVLCAVCLLSLNGLALEANAFEWYIYTPMEYTNLDEDSAVSCVGSGPAIGEDAWLEVEGPNGAVGGYVDPDNMYGWWYLLVYPPEGGWGVGWGSVALYTCQVEPERILIKVIAVYFY